MDESWRPVLQLFKIRGMGIESLRLLAMWSLVAVIVGGIVWLVHRHLQRKARLRLDRQWFFRTAALKHLTNEQVQLLQAIAPYSGSDKLLPLLTSLCLFNTAVNHFLQQQSLPPSQREGLLSELQAIRSHLHFDHAVFGEVLHSTHTLPPGQQVRMLVFHAERERNLYGMVTAIHDDGLTVELLDKASHISWVRRGAEVTLSVLRAGDAEYHGVSHVLERNTGAACTLTLAHVSQLSRHQRRAYFRIPVRLDVLIWPLTEHQTRTYEQSGRVDIAPESVPAEGLLTSLSGGGASILLSQPIVYNALISVTLILSPRHHIYHVTARIARVTQIADMRYRISIAFLDATQRETEQIIRFVLKTERQRLAEAMEIQKSSGKVREES